MKKKIGIALVLVVICITGLAIATQVFPDLAFALKIKELPKPEATRSSEMVQKVDTKPISLPPYHGTPLEIIPNQKMVGHRYPFCGETDVIVAYHDARGEKEAFLIPSCYQVKLGLSSTNLRIFEVVAEVDGWLRIKMNPTDQIYPEDVKNFHKIDTHGIDQGPYDPKVPRIVEMLPADSTSDEIQKFNGQVDTIMEGTSWIKKDQAFTAWTLRDDDKIYLIESVNPSVNKEPDGTWSAFSLGICNSDDSIILPGNNSLDPGLQMNVNYDPKRDCGT